MGRTETSTAVQRTAKVPGGPRERLGVAVASGSAAAAGSSNGDEAVTLVITPTALRAALRAANRQLDNGGGRAGFRGDDGASTGTGVGTGHSTPTSTGSSLEEDYDDDARRGGGKTLVVRRKSGSGSGDTGPPDATRATDAGESVLARMPIEHDDRDVRDHGHAADLDDLQPLSPVSSARRTKPTATRLVGKDADGRGKTYLLQSDDAELREILRAGLQWAKESKQRKHRGKFSDLVFTRQFSTFDRQNESAANSPFHGFFTLFWLAVAIFVCKIAAENWKKTGSVLGTNEIMQLMFRRDVAVLGIADGIMCGVTGFGWILQRLVLAGYLDWDQSGWIIQNLWQTLFMGGVIGVTLLRDWPWSHTVFFVLHGIAMLMKQHSYAFYNGHLSTVSRRRSYLLSKLRQLEAVAPVPAGKSDTEPRADSLATDHLLRVPSAAEREDRRRRSSAGVVADGGTAGTAAVGDTADLDDVARAIESGKPLDLDQVQVFERLFKWEADALADELKGKATSPERAYPNNLTLKNHYEWIVLPTVVYELEYPRSEVINWYYVAEKAAATFGIIFVMIIISQAFIYPVVMRTVAMKETGMSLGERFKEFPWMLVELVFPFMMEYLLAWYLIWETVLNTLAELTYFADRSFYDAWWNSVSWDQFARDWNRPVHNFLLRHVYHSSISTLKVNKHQATLITFLLSVCVHELVMWCIFKKLRGYLLLLQMSQIPLVQLSRSRWLKGRATLGNLIFWIGIFTGPSLLCSLYLIL